MLLFTVQCTYSLNNDLLMSASYDCVFLFSFYKFRIRWITSVFPWWHFPKTLESGLSGLKSGFIWLHRAFGFIKIIFIYNMKIFY